MVYDGMVRQRLGNNLLLHKYIDVADVKIFNPLDGDIKDSTCYSGSHGLVSKPEYLQETLYSC